MTPVPIVEPVVALGAPRARRLSSSDFGEGDILAEKYLIEAVLGEGGMGIVLSATHLELGCRVAIKVMRSEFAHSDDAVTRLLVEARAAASIRSEHVARVLDVGRLESGIPFLVLEHLEGRDLAQILRKSGRLASQIAVDFVLQACQALSEAHSAGIVHRDLKPENLFLSSRADGTLLVKVLDFGISKRLTQDGREAAVTNPSELLGSPLYMAPEQMNSTQGVDARADIWSLGVVLYELCTGQSPFFGETIPSICARVIGVDPAPPSSLVPDVPPGLEAVILRCLSKDPASRPADVAELAAALAEYGSADASAYAQSARLVIDGARTNPALAAPTLAAPRVRESIPIGLSATLPVFGQGLRPPPPRRLRLGLVGAAAVCATLLGGAVKLRSGQAHEAGMFAAGLSTPPASLPVPTLPAPSVDVEPRGASLPDASIRVLASAPKPPVTRPRTAETTRNSALKRSIKRGLNAWDPKSFGGRL
jgi:serine/threonine-protein kinase